MTDFDIQTPAETAYLYVERTCSMAPDDISATMGSAFQQVYAFMNEAGVQPAGPALAVYYSYAPDSLSFRAGFTVARTDLAHATGEVHGDITPSRRAVHFIHKGSYATLRDSYGEMMGWIASQGEQMAPPTWELYLNDPSTTPEDALLTEVYCALA